MDSMLGFGWGFHGFGWLFWLLIIAIIFFLFRSDSGSPGKNDKSALDILKERFARDEITKEEFEEKKKYLG